jgi:phosphoribosylformylglycinamidine synthase
MSTAKRPARAVVLRSAGTNCERETVLALEAAGAAVELVHLHRWIAAPALLDGFALLVIPGGFSYGDDVAAGRVFGYELRRHLARELSAFVDRGGLVLGVCNGFQILVEAGLFGERGTQAHEREIALSANASGRFECRWVTLRAEPCACRWLEGLVFPAPVAHGEGRFVTRDRAALERLERRGQIALRYATPAGAPTDAWPDCPNGSLEGIAGICDPTGRVLGLMPHPERNVTPWHHPLWTRLGERVEGEGLAFYRRMVEVAEASQR